MIKRLGNKLAYILIGVVLAIAGTAYAINVTIPQSQQKGDLPTGTTSGNYTLFHPGPDGTIPIASSTSPNGIVWGNASSSSASVLWGSITGTLSSQTDLQNALNAKLSTTTAASTYQPIGSYVTNSYASSTFPSFGYASSTFPSFTYASSTYYLATNPSSFISGNQTITLSGDVSGTGATAITTAIGAGKVTNTMLAGSIAASKLVGSDIATVGTITSGTWNGSVIPILYGGTATSSLPANNGVLVSDGTNYQFSVLPSCSNTSTSKLLYNNSTRAFTCGTDQSGGGGGATTTITSTVQVDGPNFTFATGSDTNLLLNIIGNNGSGTQTFTPQWTGTLAAARLNSNVVQAITNDTNVTGSISAQNLTLGWTGVLSPARGGTGTSTVPTQQGQILIADSTGTKYTPGTHVNTTTFSWGTSTVAQLTGNVLKVPNALTFNNGGSGASSGQTFDGSAAATISYNTIGAQVAGTYLGNTNVSGTSGQLPYFTGANTVNSTAIMLYNGSVFGMNATSSTIGFNIQGTAGTNDIFNVASSSGTSILKVTALSRVGIGSSTPTAVLTVQGTSGATTDVFNVSSSTGSSMFIVKSTGFVGIGSSSPAAQFTVVGSLPTSTVRSLKPLCMEAPAADTGATTKAILNAAGWSVSAGACP